MKKILAVLTALALASLGLMLGASAASATGGDTPADNKSVTFCHATAVPGKYEKITTSLNAFLNAGHVDHVQGGQKDIYPAITYTTKGGQTVTIPAQGDQSLLAFEDCAKPAEDTKIAKPTPVIVDKCETKDDVLSVAPGTGYTVGNVNVVGLVQTVIVTLQPGFQWADGSKTPLTFTHTFTDVDCDLPETGAGATFNTMAGSVALVGLAGGLFMLLTGGRRKATI